MLTYKKPYLPRRSGVHRIAAFALYRALLNECLQVPVDNNSQLSLQNVVRHRFQKHRTLTSKQLVLSAFDKGYQALDILAGAAAGEDPDLQRIDDFLKAAPDTWKQSYQAPPPVRHRFTKDQPWPDEPLVGQLDVYERPYMNISGKRRVPRFAQTWGYPFLVFGKKQPLRLNQRITKWRKKWVGWNQAVEHFEHQLQTQAPWEDDWDEIVKYFSDGEIQESPSMPAWATNLETFGLRHVRNLRHEDFQRNFENAKILLAIVEDEKFLAKSEECQRTAAGIESATNSLLEEWEALKQEAQPNSWEDEEDKNGVANT